MIPKAWYSFTALRLMRPSKPCCIPRRKRTIATFGDGCENQNESAMSAIESKYTNSNHQLDIDGDLAGADPGEDDPGRHAHDVPEILLTDEVAAIGDPLLRLSVKDVAHDRECPCEQSQPRPHGCAKGVAYKS